MATMLKMLRDLLFRNKGLKLLALVLATIAWMAIQETISVEREIKDIPVNILLAPGWAVLDVSNPEVDVVFRGAREDLLRLNRDLIEVAVDLRKVDVRGDLAITLTPANVKDPIGARAVFIAPERIEISIDREGSRKLPVKADIQGHLPDGYAQVRVACEPAFATVSGPMRKLAGLSAVRTTPILLDGHADSFTTRVPLVIPEDTWQPDIVPPRASVSITVVARADSRVLEQVPVRTLENPGGRHTFDIKPTTVNVTIEGGAKLLEKIDQQVVRAYVDCSALESATRYELPVRIDVPEHVRVRAIEPQAVVVVVE